MNNFNTHVANNFNTHDINDLCSGLVSHTGGSLSKLKSTLEHASVLFNLAN